MKVMKHIYCTVIIDEQQTFLKPWCTMLRNVNFILLFHNFIPQNNDNDEPQKWTIAHDGFVMNGVIHAHVKTVN